MSAPAAIDLAGLAAFPLPSLAGVDDKEGRGGVLVVAGGARVPGAPILTGTAALRAGAGKLQLAAVGPAAIALGLAVPEAAIITVAGDAGGEMAAAAARDLADALGRAAAVVVGPGMAGGGAPAELAMDLMAASTGAVFVVDAAALTGLALAADRTRRIEGRLIVTPHAGEMAKVLGRTKEDVQRDPLGAARTLAESLRAVVVMKGARSFIVSPDGRAMSHGGGVVGLGTSGSGDVLAGLIGGLAARGAAPFTAALWGVCIHAAAGARLTKRIGRVGFLARELLPEIPPLLDEAEDSAVSGQA